jgi:hypothetical protein
LARFNWNSLSFPADELLVLAVTWWSGRDGGRDRLIVGADILDGDGSILAESPRVELVIPGPNGADSAEDRRALMIARDIESAMGRMETWLISQVPMMQAVLVSAGLNG